MLDGEVTQSTRGAGVRYADEATRRRTRTCRPLTLDGTTFEVTAVDERTLGDLTDGDARREGSPSLDAYQRRMERVHPGNFE